MQAGDLLGSDGGGGKGHGEGVSVSKGCVDMRADTGPSIRKAAHTRRPEPGFQDIPPGCFCATWAAGRWASRLFPHFPHLVHLQILLPVFQLGPEATPLTAPAVPTCHRLPPGPQRESSLCPKALSCTSEPVPWGRSGAVHPFTPRASSDLRSPCSPCLTTSPLAAPLFGPHVPVGPSSKTSLTPQLRGAAPPGSPCPTPPPMVPQGARWGLGQLLGWPLGAGAKEEGRTQGP